MALRVGLPHPQNRGGQVRRFFDVLDSGASRVGFADCWRRNAKTGSISFILSANVTYTDFRRCDDNRVPPF